MKVSPASSLSIRRVVDIYTFVAFIGVGVFLFFLGHERYSDFRSAHQESAEKVVQIAAREINDIIANKRREVALFSEDHRDLIFKLSQYPDNEGLHAELNDRIRRHIPDFFASNIMTLSGTLVIGDFDGKVGDLCMSDMRHFVDEGRQRIRVHPNNDVYHYDVLTKISNGKDKLLFFVSFNLSELANFLTAVQPTNHTLMLVNKDMQNLIEITPSGGRETIAGRIDYRLTGDEKMRIMSSEKVDGTMWNVIDLHSPVLMQQYIETLLRDYLIVYFIFSLIAFYMRYLLINEDKRRYLAEIDLRKSNEEIKQLNDKLEHLSVTDDLTGLYNRRYIDDRLEMEWNRCQRAEHYINIAFIDVDYFKNYNDRYGHQTGDECLASVSGLMMLLFKRAGDVVARYGGEEFIVVMTDIETEDAEKILRQYQLALDGMNILHESSSISDHVTVSIGLFSSVPKQSESLHNAIKHADEALYKAKNNGRNQVCIYEKSD